MSCKVSKIRLQVNPKVTVLYHFLLLLLMTGRKNPKGDYDIMTQDWAEIKKLGLDRLRYGDIVLLEDCDNTYGRGFCRGAVTIGVVVHSDCVLVGHGPGVTALLSSKEPVIEGVIDSHANLADLFLPFTCSE